MNPFVDPKKRSILLPNGCKDLADVLQLPTREAGDSVEMFIRRMLLQAEGVEATEILIGGPMVHDGECIITQRINSTLNHMATVPAGFRSRIVVQLLRMADLPGAQFPAEGVATLKLKGRELKWKIRIESAEAECQLTPFEG